MFRTIAARSRRFSCDAQSALWAKMVITRAAIPSGMKPMTILMIDHTSCPTASCRLAGVVADPVPAV